MLWKMHAGRKKGRERRNNLCLENKLAVGKVDLALVLTLGDAGALVLLGSMGEAVSVRGFDMGRRKGSRLGRCSGVEVDVVGTSSW